MTSQRKTSFLPYYFLSFSLLFCAAVSAQQDIVNTRQDGFNEMGAAMKTLRDGLKSDKAVTPAMVVAAENLVVLAEKLPDWFPDGSGPASGVKTDARDYIWSNRQKFDDLSKALLAESQTLVLHAKQSDVSALQKQLGVIRDNCSSCHDSYRVD